MIKSTVKPAATKPAATKPTPKSSTKPATPVKQSPAKPSSANPAPTTHASAKPAAKPAPNAPAPKPAPKQAPAPVEQPPATPVKDAASRLESKVMKEKQDKEAVKPANGNAVPTAPVKAPANADAAQTKPRVPDAQKQEDVVFAWTPEGADTVQIAGSFNDWKEKLVMKNVSGKHQLSIPLKPGKYFYKFIVDGEWCYDFTAPNETDEEGNVNNVITV